MLSEPRSEAAASAASFSGGSNSTGRPRDHGETRGVSTSFRRSACTADCQVPEATTSTNRPRSRCAYLVHPALAHDLEVLPVVIHVDVARFGNRVDELLVEGPIHAAEDDAPIGDRRELFELVERRHARHGARHLEREGSRRRRE